MHACRKVPSRYDKTGALSPSRHVRAQIVLWTPTFVLQCYGRRHLPSDTNPDRNIRQPLWSRRKLMSSTVTNVGPLRRLLLVGSWLCTLARRTIRRSRMGRDHLLKQGQSTALSGSTNMLSLAPSTMSAWQAQGKGKTRHLRRTFSTSGFSSFSHLQSLLPFGL